MEQSFIQWRDSSRYRLDGDSIIISDSDEEDVVENSGTKALDKRAFIVDESYEEDADFSEHSTPKM